MSHDAPSLVVGVGASAGGLQAFRELLSVLPRESGAAYLFVQHLDPNHESLLAELLASHTEMSVRDAEQGEAIRADTVYVISPGDALAVRDGRIELSEPTLHRGIRLPVDHLFRSLARQYGDRAVGIVLSGAGSDGSSGLRDLKGMGGLTIAQEPGSCGQPGMPRSAIDTGLVDLVLEISEMPRALERFATLPPGARAGPPVETSVTDTRVGDEAGPGEDHGEGGRPSTRLEDGDLMRLKALLAAQIDFDLGVYKSGTVERRVLRRMLLSGFERVGDYIDHLRERPLEQQTLVRDLLISVTSFFRDTEAHRALRESVVEPLIGSLPAGADVRVWVAGCATGEEAYSIGMTILDAAVERDKTIELQIFATDVDRDALAFARAANYPPSISEQVPRARLERYFHPFDGHGYRVRSALRDRISFAVHDLTRDPPFSRMDIVSCRNVLIYLTPEAQSQVLGMLHFALRPGGHLVLSTSESAGAAPDLFTTVSKPARIYRKLGNSRAVPMQHKSPTRLAARTREGAEEREGAGSRTPRAVSDPARRAVLEAWAPPTLVVSGDGTVQFAHGELGPYLSFPQGDNPRFTLDTMLRREIATRTRGALYRCRRNRRTVTALLNPGEEREQRVRITAKPVPSLGDDTVMLSFETLAGDERGSGERRREAATAEGSPETVDDKTLIEQLESELHATREDLRSTVEELETSNEELRSSNEESMSMNEELQSANEELEATTEELRSLNEELTTLNGQLREKIEQLEQANDDLGNFFTSARVAMVFLDARLRIKRFTPAAAELLGIDRADLGRFVGNIARELLQHELEHEAHAVFEHLETRSREITTRENRWFSRRVLPYLTENRRIEGVVVTLQDITEIRLATERLAARERQQSVIARLGLDALGERDLQRFMDRAIEVLRKTLALDYAKILELQPGDERLLLRAGSGWSDGLVGTAFVDSGSKSQAGYTLATVTPVVVEDLATDPRFSGPALLVEHGVTSGLSCVIRDAENTYGVLGGHSRTRREFAPEDVDFVQALANLIGLTIGHYQAQLRIRLENAIARTLTGRDDPEDTLAAVAGRLCAELGAAAGEIWWRYGGASAELVCRRLYTAPGEDRAELRARLSGRDVAHESDLVERVVADDRAVYATDLGEPALFAADERARALRFSTAVCFPLRSGERLLGAMALYARQRLFVNESFLRTLESLGRGIGDRIVRVEQERRAARLAAITESSHDALFSHDAEGRVSEWLPGAERLFGFGADEMIGASMERLVPEALRAERRRITARILAGESVEPFESVRLDRDGREIEVSVRSSPILDGDGRVIGVSETDRDISALKATARRLRAADQQKDEFLAMLGHELRNPLASIRTAAELLALSESDDPEVRHTQAIIERQSKHMARLLDGLLDVSRIINGKITLDTEVIDLVEICREVLADSTQRARERGIALSVTLPEETIAVAGDRIRLVQIVDNLLSNAIRYTPEGGSVALALAREGERVTLRVRDDGVGIDAELLPYVFDVFRQAQRNLDRAEGGLGIGLSLVRSLVALHGGDVEASSEGAGRGAEFTVRLPVSEVPLPSPVQDERDARIELDVLIIEDNADTADVMKRVLRRFGHRVSTAANGRHGIEMAVREPPDVVLCDLGLPDGVSGYDVVRELRTRPETRRIRVIALSGYGRPEDKAQSLEAGFDAHLTKPVGLETLKLTLSDASD